MIPVSVALLDNFFFLRKKRFIAADLHREPIPPWQGQHEVVSPPESGFRNLLSFLSSFHSARYFGHGMILLDNFNSGSHEVVINVSKGCSHLRCP